MPLGFSSRNSELCSEEESPETQWFWVPDFGEVGEVSGVLSAGPVGSSFFKLWNGRRMTIRNLGTYSGSATGSLIVPVILYSKSLLRGVRITPSMRLTPGILRRISASIRALICLLGLIVPWYR